MSQPVAQPWTAVVIGGCGFFGRHLLTKLAASPSYSTVAAIDIKTDKDPVDGVDYFAADLGSAAEVAAVFAKAKPHVVYHTASPPATTSNLPLYMRVNVDGTRNLLQQAKKASVSAFVYTSSASVIHDSVSDMFEADDTARVLYLPEQREVYSHSKALAEDLVIAANDPPAGFVTASLRPSAIFGEGDFMNVGRLLEVAKSGRANMQMGNGTNFFDYTYVENLADAHLLATEKLLTKDSANGKVDGETFLISNDQHWRFWDFARAVAAAAGYHVQPHEIKIIPRWFGLILAVVAEWWVWVVSGGQRRSALSVTGVKYSTLTRTYNITKAKERLGYKPKISMEEGIKRSVAWHMSRADQSKKDN